MQGCGARAHGRASGRVGHRPWVGLCSAGAGTACHVLSVVQCHLKGRGLHGEPPPDFVADGTADGAA